MIVISQAAKGHEQGVETMLPLVTEPVSLSIFSSAGWNSGSLCDPALSRAPGGLLAEVSPHSLWLALLCAVTDGVGGSGTTASSVIPAPSRPSCLRCAPDTCCSGETSFLQQPNCRL